MAIEMGEVRLAALAFMGIESAANKYIVKLPKDFGTHPSIFTYNGMKFKVLTTAEAHATSKTKQPVRPQRILVWDEACSKWQFAGKYCQHMKCTKHKMLKEAKCL